MTTTNKKLLLIFIALFTISLPAPAAEPNDLPQQVRFEVSDAIRKWRTDVGGAYGQGPIKPTHVAEVIVATRSQHAFFKNPDEIQQLKESPAGRSISKEQFEFLATSDAFFQMDRDQPVRNYRRYLLYAVSVEQARKMTEAFLEVATAKAEQVVQRYTEQRDTCQRLITKEEDSISELEAKLQAAKIQKEKCEKRGRYLDPNEAATTVREMNSLLNTLIIEIQGIQSKVEKIEWYLASHSQDPHSTLKPKLEEMLMVETVALKGACARQEAVNAIREEAKTFVDAFNGFHSYTADLKRARHQLGNDQRVLHTLEVVLASPQPDMLPPVVYQNKVTIHPVDPDLRDDSSEKGTSGTSPSIKENNSSS